jgi:3-methyl-2-oxobutanoate hydroxymethyltransferase
MTTEKIKSMKAKEAITVLTCYGYPMARILEETGIDIILVGDSLGNVVLGYDSTKEVTINDMLRHTGAVRRGAVSSFIISDMPYKSDETIDLAIKNANLLIDSGADAVKIEGKPDICKALVQNGIAVMGHIGHLPQTAEKPIVHKDKDKLLNEAKSLEQAGCFAIVLEMVQTDIAKEITDSLKIPTIGIGAGPYCDGQVLVINDMLGLYEDFKPKFVKKYAHLNDEIRKAVKTYKKEVKAGEFPGDEFSFK